MKPRAAVPTAQNSLENMLPTICHRLANLSIINIRENNITYSHARKTHHGAVGKSARASTRLSAGKYAKNEAEPQRRHGDDDDAWKSITRTLGLYQKPITYYLFAYPILRPTVRFW